MIALRRKLNDGRTLENALRAIYGPGEWEATQNKSGFVITYHVQGLPQYGEGRPPHFWVELKPPTVRPWLSSGEICERAGIRFR